MKYLLVHLFQYVTKIMILKNVGTKTLKKEQVQNARVNMFLKIMFL